MSSEPVVPESASTRKPAPRQHTVADLVAVELRVQRGIGNADRREQMLRQIATLKDLLGANAATDISSAVSVLDQELEDLPRRYIPLAAILLLIIAATAVVLVATPEISRTDQLLGYNLIFLLTAAGAGFLGSFVRVLNKVVSYEYSDMSPPTAFLVMLLRPIAGAALGLFVAAVFAAGGVGNPVGNTADELFAGITKGSAFIFAVAFMAGFVDDFALNVANRFATVVKASVSPPGGQPPGR